MKRGKPAVSIAGQTFGNLLVKERAGTDKHGNSSWLCECVCGSSGIRSWVNLRDGKQVSCGCIRRSVFKETKICPSCRCQKPHESFGGRKPDGLRGSVRTYCFECINAKQKVIYSVNPDRYKEQQKQARTKLKSDVFGAYGDKCACCGERQKMFLAIDHINNDGARHRRKAGGGDHTYAWLRKNNYPPGFQVLCANCNWGKYVNGGVCPHVG